MFKISLLLFIRGKAKRKIDHFHLSVCLKTPSHQIRFAWKRNQWFEWGYMMLDFRICKIILEFLNQYGLVLSPADNSRSPIPSVCSSLVVRAALMWSYSRSPSYFYHVNKSGLFPLLLECKECNTSSTPVTPRLLLPLLEIEKRNIFNQ